MQMNAKFRLVTAKTIDKVYMGFVTLKIDGREITFDFRNADTKCGDEGICTTVCSSMYFIDVLSDELGRNESNTPASYLAKATEIVDFRVAFTAQAGKSTLFRCNVEGCSDFVELLELSFEDNEATMRQLPTPVLEAYNRKFENDIAQTVEGLIKREFFEFRDDMCKKPSLEVFNNASEIRFYNEIYYFADSGYLSNCPFDTLRCLMQCGLTLISTLYDYWLDTEGASVETVGDTENLISWFVSDHFIP